MEYSIDSRNIQGVFNLVVEIDGEESLIPTPLDKVGMDLLLEAIVEFIEDSMWDVTDMSIQASDEDEPIGIIIDMYKGEDDDDPITTTYWFDDYIDDEPDNDDDEPKITKMKKND